MIKFLFNFKRAVYRIKIVDGVKINIKLNVKKRIYIALIKYKIKK